MLPEFPVIEGVEFKHIPGWEGYAVSSDGKAWSCRVPSTGGFAATWRELNPIKSKKSGYYSINLKNCGKMKVMRMNVLIANLFLGGIPEGYVAAHYPQADKANNSVSNIKVCAQKENKSHMKEQGTYVVGEEAPNVKMNNELVLDIRKLHAEGESFHSLSRLFQIDRATVKQIVKRQTWTHI